jgi:gas vesicle protein
MVLIMSDQSSDSQSEGEYQASGSGLTMLLIGLAAGALIALLFAPKTGKQMRKTLRRSYEDAREMMEDIGDQAGDWMDKGSEWADTAKSKVSPLAKKFRR